VDLTPGQYQNYVAKAQRVAALSKSGGISDEYMNKRAALLLQNKGIEASPENIKKMVDYLQQLQAAGQSYGNQPQQQPQGTTVDQDTSAPEEEPSEDEGPM